MDDMTTPTKSDSDREPREYQPDILVRLSGHFGHSAPQVVRDAYAEIERLRKPVCPVVSGPPFVELYCKGVGTVKEPGMIPVYLSKIVDAALTPQADTPQKEKHV